MTKLAKHITIKHHRIRSLYEQGCIEPAYVNTKDQIADVLTKGLLSVEHLRICRKSTVLPERVEQQDTQNVNLSDIQQLVKENNYGWSPWNSQAARGRHGKSQDDYLNTLVLCSTNQTKPAPAPA